MPSKKTPQKRQISAEGRQRIAEAQKARWAAQKAAAAAAPPTPTQWKAADKATKQQLLAEYDALPSFTGAKEAWIKEHGTSNALLGWHRKQFRKEPPSTAVVLHASSNDAALLAEYDALPHGEKRAWLKSQGLYKTWAYNARYRLSRNGHSLPAANRAARSQPLPTVHVLPQATPGPLVTLEDAINAMQVRQDHMAEFLDMLKRMSRGQL